MFMYIFQIICCFSALDVTFDVFKSTRHQFLVDQDVLLYFFFLEPYNDRLYYLTRLQNM